MTRIYGKYLASSLSGSTRLRPSRVRYCATHLMKLAKSSQSRATSAQTESHGAILETGYDRKAAISDRDYAFIREIVYRETRINLGNNKRELVAARLGKRLRMLGISSFNAYCSLLKDRSSGEELYHLIDAISTNHTFFFREANHFNFLNSSILPAFERGEIGDSRSMRLWSCACSTGEEPYSVAISLAERVGMNSPASWHIECTDISTRVLRFASKAVYTEAHLQQVNPKTRKRYFQTGRGANAGSFRIRPELRNHLSFSRLNLFESALPWKEKFHCIWCRNVMIYFDRKTQEGLVGRLSEHLYPGGFLLIGHAESLAGISHPFRIRECPK